MPRKPPQTTPSARTIRCAIYTRKSTEEGLEQPFNSLDAQREAAEAYIASQRHQAWTVLPERFDDGGYTGANMHRPALQRLLAAVEAGRVDCVIVYKVDRLSRSLLDFARILQVLEQHGATFVSITQHFNTTSSIGRLTLNVLLSFAEFERCLVSERTRDKMSAARRKGKWVGGTPPLGYDVAPEGGRLVINAAEAEVVREIFSLYLEQHSVLAVAAELNRRGRRTKQWTSRRGRHHAGLPFSKNAVAVILRNQTYTGQVRFRGETFAGEHPPIVGARTWEQTRDRLGENRAELASKRVPEAAAPLSGLLFCPACEARMFATHAIKAGRGYRYYVCSTAHRRGWQNCPTKSVSADRIEKAVVEALQSVSPGAHKWREVGRRIQEMVERVTYHRAAHTAWLVLRKQFGGEQIEIPVVRLGGAPRGGRVPRVARLMALAIRCEELVRTGVVEGYGDLVRLGTVSRPRITQLMNLLNLTPQIQEEILFLPDVESGREPVNESLVRRLPATLCWRAQVETWHQLRTDQRICGGAASLKG